jgi:cytochrome c-type biogenesis protein CcmE
MKQRRLKIIAASAILLCGFVVLVLSMTKKESMPELTPAKLVANADKTDNQNVKVVGVISSKKSSTWDAANSKLTFAIREPEGNETVDVIYTDLKPDNFTDGGNVFVEGIYNAEKNLVVATKLTTKCASKYEGAESATTQKSSY